MSIAGGCDKAVLLAQAAGCDAVQLFTKNNNQWNATALDEEHITRFRRALEETKIEAPVAHASYLINLASPDDTLWNRSIAAMIDEVNRCAQLGIGDLVVHPGAHMGQGEDPGLTRIAQALDTIIERGSDPAVTIDLETTAGQGSSLGCRFEHLKAVIDRCRHPERIGVCADTCHLFAAGYPLATAAEYEETIGRMQETFGLKTLRVWHVNDSLRGLGSRVDRHAGIGLGLMGLEPFRNLLSDARFQDRRFIMETPKGTMDGEDLDVRNLRVLRALVKPRRGRTR